MSPVRSVLFRAWYRDKIARLTAFRVTYKHFEAPVGCHDIPLSQGGVARGTLYRLLFPIARRKGSPFRLRAFAMKSSLRRRASFTRWRHSSCDRFASVESADSCPRQRAGAARRQMRSRAATGAFIFRHHSRSSSPSWASNRRAGLTRQDRESQESLFNAAAKASFSLALS